MRALSFHPALHVSAMGIGAVLFLLVRTFNIAPFFGCFNERMLSEYSVNWPGLDALEKHEVFNPAYLHSKKIVFLGGSNVEAMGCDKTWSQQIAGQERNAHISCSVSGQLEKLLHDHGHKDWKVFNMGRNAGDIISSIATFLRLLKLKPEIVILGADGWIFRLSKEGVKLGGIGETLQQSGVDVQVLSEFNRSTAVLGDLVPKDHFSPGQKLFPPIEPLVCSQMVTPIDLFASTLLKLRRPLIQEAPLRIPELYPYPFEGEALASYSVGDDLLKKSVRTELVEFIPLLQKLVESVGGRFMVYQPYSRTRSYKHQDWKKHFETKFFSVIHQHEVDLLDLLHLPLTPKLDDYDAVHLTYYGNLKVAKEIEAHLEFRQALY